MQQFAIAFIGVGRMGGGMARRLLAAGYPVTIYDPNPDAVAPCLAQGAKAAESASAVVESADIVFTSLPLPEHLLALYAGPGAVTESLRPGTTCVDVSTVDPGTARQVSDRLAEQEVEFVACPVGKGPAQAAEGTVPLFVGGSAAAVERLRPVLTHIGTPLHHLGEVEAATAFKLISNLIGMTNLAILAEGYLLGRRAGIEPTAFLAALQDTGAASYQLNLRLPAIAADDHEARFAVDLALKDLRLAIQSAARWRIPVPVGAASLQQLAAASAHGYGDEDVTAIVKVLDPTGTVASGGRVG